MLGQGAGRGWLRLRRIGGDVRNGALHVRFGTAR
jgi:hypothetical protein